MPMLFSKRSTVKYLQILVLFSFLLPFQSLADQVGFKEALSQKSERYRQSGKLTIEGRELYAPKFAIGIYVLNRYQPLWNSDNRQALFDSIDTLYEDGLTPEEYILPEVAGYLELERTDSLNATKRLELDLLLLEGLIRALYNLAFGKVDPTALDPNINFTRPLSNNDFAPILLKQIQSGDLLALFDEIRPKQSEYLALKKGLANYRMLQENGGWLTIPGGKTLKPGGPDERVMLLRNRLQRTNADPIRIAPQGGENFDADLEDSVKSFQRQHGLEVDGTVGPATLAALNVSVEDRIDQILINLERQRWYLHALEGEFIIVDIAGFKAYWFKNGDVIWEERVQVGQDFTSTPIFKDKIQYLDFNPTWTIPPGIINRTIKPNLKKDSTYLKKKGYELYSLEGNPIDAEAIDWASIKGFPYVVRQPPGPNNAMGLVKFMFPNPHFVFLHDTNHRELFGRTSRTFSSGCIRVRNPFDLAEKLLANQGDWDREKIDKAIASGKTTRVNLDKAISIIIGYRTAFAVGDKVHFQQDIYNRDPGILMVLKDDFRLRKQDLTRK